MDLSALARQKTTDGASLNAHREKLAQEHLEQGVALMRQAHEEEFKHPGLLTQAGEAFIAAIQYNRTKPEPYLAMAYLFMLVENFEAAGKYAQEVCRLHPDNKDAHLMIEQITKSLHEQKKQVAMPQPPSKPDFSPSLPESPDEIDYDELYDQTEALIIAEVHKIASYPSPEPISDPKKLKELAKYQKALERIIANIQEQLQIIDEEIETTHLQTKLKPLEIVTKRYHSAIEISQHILALHQRIEEEQQLVAEQLNSLPEIESREDLKVMEENLDTLLDGTDQIADNIDALENKGYAAKETEKKYESLIKDVEKLQDAIDDISEKLHDKMS